jgi:predicted DNA-binding transcriptional regulator YafY
MCCQVWPAVKSDRLVALLLALQSDGKLPAPELAEKLEVSQRTIYRDIEALSAAGVPIYAERGAQGGIVLADSYRDALGRFDEGELHALFVSSDDVLADVGLIGRRKSALSKLAKALPVRERAKIERSRGRVHIDTRRWAYASAPSDGLITLREAIWADLAVTFDYVGREGVESRRNVDPFGLVAKAGVWYLVARDRDVVKTFRVQRISDLRVTNTAFTRPPAFDLAAYWETVADKVSESKAPVRATIVMSDRAVANAQIYLAVLARTAIVGSSPRQWSVEVEFASIGTAVHEIIGWSGEAIVVDPPELRERLIEAARRVLARYCAPVAAERRGSR